MKKGRWTHFTCCKTQRSTVPTCTDSAGHCAKLLHLQVFENLGLIYGLYPVVSQDPWTAATPPGL